MKTALIYHPIFLQHNTGPHHPERPARLESVLRKLQRSTLFDKLKLVEPQPASIEDIALVHSKDYILYVKDICSLTRVTCLSEALHMTSSVHNLDPDTVVSDKSFDSALFASGAVLKSIELVFNKEIDNAFCLVRPPGHHAGPSQAMGFCIFNNIAIGARYLRTKYKLNRILIIDWDAHHGNGTEEIFYEDPTVFYISLHQYPHYPGTGSKEDIGRGEGEGYNLNIPMQAGQGDSEYIKVFHDIVIPRVKDYKPEFILISAGFDGHMDDPLSSLNLTETGYYEMTKFVKDIAHLYSENRIVSVLEGGYNLISLANSVYSHLLGLECGVTFLPKIS